jgi:hypothetical protein
MLYSLFKNLFVGNLRWIYVEENTLKLTYTLVIWTTGFNDIFNINFSSILLYNQPTIVNIKIDYCLYYLAHIINQCQYQVIFIWLISPAAVYL